MSPTTWSRASDYVGPQIRLIETLEGKGFTYETSDGVYFDIQKFPRYGCLGHIDVAKLQSGARVAINEEKHHPADFAVWKKSALGWDSRWGKGFPGWHIECSAMAIATLGKEIDIHTGVSIIFQYITMPRLLNPNVLLVRSLFVIGYMVNFLLLIVPKLVNQLEIL
jgi:cysteinyl-tRNA synthetase